MRPDDEFIQRDRDQHPPAHTPVYKSSVLRSPHLAFWSLQNSLSETIVPWFGHGQLDLRDNDLILNHSQGGEAIGERMVAHGRVLDENGRGIPETLVEIWQANAAGKYDHPADRQDKSLDPVFHGWGRAGTDFAAGLYAFETVKPGIVEGRHGRPMAPHVNVLVDEGLMSDRPHVQFVMGVRNAIPAEEHLLDLLLGEMRIVLPRATWTAAGMAATRPW